MNDIDNYISYIELNGEITGIRKCLYIAHQQNCKELAILFRNLLREKVNELQQYE